MKTVGLTGGIGSGKTTVANFFRDLGVPVYIADDAGKELMNTSAEIKRKIVDLFGRESYKENQPNRSYIASQVFNNSEKLEALNNIIHPAVAEDFRKWKAAQNAAYIIYEAAILFEKGGYKNLDFTILVTADYNERIRRIRKRDQSSVEDIEARMKNQWSDEKKKVLADFIIENHNLRETKARVKALHFIILKSGKN